MAGENIVTNVKDRIQSVAGIPQNLADATGILLDDTVNLKPIQGLASALQKVGDGTLKAIDENAKITRRWTGQLNK